MNCVDEKSLKKVKNSVSSRNALSAVLILAAAIGLAACGNKEKKGGQALVKVNGEDASASM